MKTKNWKGLVCVGLMVLLAGAGEIWADTVYTWTGTVAGDDWLTPENWSPNGQPNPYGTSGGSRDTALINTLPGATLYDGVAGCWAVRLGVGVPDAEGRLDVYGGELRGPGGLDIGWDATTTGTVNIYGGTTHSARYIVAGANGTGTFNMYDGFFRVTNTLRVAYYATGTGLVNLEGGTLSIVGLYMPYNALMVINNGVLLYDGDRTDPASYLMASCIDTGKIIAAEGKTLQIEFDSVLNQTRITAVPEPATLVLLAAGALVCVRKRMH